MMSEQLEDDSAESISPSALVEELQRIPVEEALDLVDRLLGPPGEWPSPLIAYRLTSDFQADWKAEVGQWLRAAEQFGFLERVMHEIRSHAKGRSKGQTGEIDPNDRQHLKLHQHLAAARIIHYLTATGWGFRGYETETGGAVDIDCSLVAPGGQVVEFQVKSPDQPGRRAGHRDVDGDFDERVITAAQHAMEQLRRPATGPALVAICANRSWGLAGEPACLVHHLIGSTIQRVGEGVFLEGASTGGFFRDEWAHVSGVLLLDLGRGEEIKYTRTVITNPRAAFSVSPSWFPHGRVCILDGSTFHWVRGTPGRMHDLPDGTQLIEALPPR
jgi:hypothetical protein